MSESFHKAKNFSNIGIETGEIKLNLQKMMSNKESSVATLTKGVEFLFKKNKVTYIKGVGSFNEKNEILLQQLKQILEMNDVDLVWIPRVNTVEGFTQEDVHRWGWRVTEQGWVNYPDYQARVFKRDSEIRWTRPLHEYITGCKTYAHLPPQEELSLYHPKTKEKQEQQNQFYMDNFSRDLLVRKS